jgi:hypothetical protein
MNNNGNTENTLLMSGKAHFHAWLCQQTDLSAAGSEHLTWTSPCPLHSAKVIAMCNLFLWHCWSPFLSECVEMYSNCQCTAVQSHAANISVKCVTIVSSICYGSNSMVQPLTQHISMQVLGTMSPGGLISGFRDITWPIHSPDLAVPNYFHCG